MSNILAVDTSSPAAGYAISSGEKIVASLTVNTGSPHSQSLFPTISTLCNLAGIALDSIDAFAAVTGPGSFTGLRVGLAAVKGLADSLGKPALGRTAFDLLALSSGHTGSHLITIGAGRGEVFCGLREVDEIGGVRSSAEDCVCKTSSMLDIFAGSLKCTNLTLIVEREGREDEIDELLTNWKMFPSQSSQPSRPSQLVRSKRERVHLADYLALSAAKTLHHEMQLPLTPYYIRPSDAEIKKKP